MAIRRVLVTGGNGFIGRHVVERLRTWGDIPLIFDRQRGHPLTQVLGDVRDASGVSEAVASVDGVIHLAGVLGTQETIDNPMPAVETNIVGSLNVFQACWRYQVPCVYITVGNYWMQNPYSISKTTAERFAWMYIRERHAAITVVRALNAYGPGQKAHPVRKIIPTFLGQALRGEPIEIYGDGTQIMDMIYVEDLAEVLVRALGVLHPVYEHPFEAGTGWQTTVNEIADRVSWLCGSSLPHHYLPMRPGEPPHSVVMGDPRTLTPLGPLVLRTLEEGLARTLPYYKEQL